MRSIRRGRSRSSSIPPGPSTRVPRPASRRWRRRPTAFYGWAPTAASIVSTASVSSGCRHCGPSSDEAVSALMVTRSGDLWIGYQFGRIAILRQGKLIDVSPRQSEIWIFGFLEDRSGAVWALTGTRGYEVLRYASGRWTHIGRRWGINGFAATDIAPGPERCHLASGPGADPVPPSRRARVPHGGDRGRQGLLRQYRPCRR